MYSTKNSKSSSSIENFKVEVLKYRNFIYRRDYVTTPAESQFYNRLLEFIGWRDILVFTKVRVEDIIGFNPIRKWFRPWSISSRLDRSHIDFVCVRKSDLRVMCAIELDDPTHNSVVARERDEVKNFLFQLVGIPLFRFDSMNPTDEEFIAKGL